MDLQTIVRQVAQSRGSGEDVAEKLLSLFEEEGLDLDWLKKKAKDEQMFLAHMREIGARQTGANHGFLSALQEGFLQESVPGKSACSLTPVVIPTLPPAVSGFLFWTKSCGSACASSLCTGALLLTAVQEGGTTEVPVVPPPLPVTATSGETGVSPGPATEEADAEGETVPRLLNQAAEGSGEREIPEGSHAETTSDTQTTERISILSGSATPRTLSDPPPADLGEEFHDVAEGDGEAQVVALLVIDPSPDLSVRYRFQNARRPASEDRGTLLQAEQGKERELRRSPRPIPNDARLFCFPWQTGENGHTSDSGDSHSLDSGDSHSVLQFVLNTNRGTVSRSAESPFEIARPGFYRLRNGELRVARFRNEGLAGRVATLKDYSRLGLVHLKWDRVPNETAGETESSELYDLLLGRPAHQSENEDADGMRTAESAGSSGGLLHSVRDGWDRPGRGSFLHSVTDLIRGVLPFKQGGGKAPVSLAAVETAEFPDQELITFLQECTSVDGSRGNLIVPQAGSATSSGGIEGVVMILRSFLQDSMTRGLFFQEELGKLFKMGQSEEFCDSRVGSLLQNLTPKDILIGLLHVCPPASVLPLAAKVGLPLPLVFRPAPSVRDDDFDKFHLGAFQPIFATPSLPLIVSMGPAPGKTTLLEHFRSMQAETSSVLQMDTETDSPLHQGSIDLHLPVKGKGGAFIDFPIVDHHGLVPFGTRNRAMTRALCSVSALICLHVRACDVKDALRTDNHPAETISDALADYLVLMPAEREVGEGSGSSVLVFARDSDAEEWGRDKRKLEVLKAEMRKTFGQRFVGLVPVRNVSKISRDPVRLKNQMAVPLEETIELISPVLNAADCPILPSFPRVLELYNKARSSDAALRPGEERRSDFDLRVRSLLDQAVEGFPDGDGDFASRLFPISAAKSEEARSERLLVESGKGRACSADQKSSAATVAECRERQLKSTHEGAFRAFLDLLVQYDPGRLAEFQKILEDWKAPRIDALLEESRRLREEKVSLEIKQSERATELEVKIAHVDRKIAEFDISFESFFAEVTALLDVRPDAVQQMQTLSALHPDLTLDCVKHAVRQHILSVQPQQILLGDPLHACGKLIGEILADLKCDAQIEKKKSRSVKSSMSFSLGKGGEQHHVISVIGAQSSAKSTLMNFLFRCGFATRAGRCTKGLYASLLEHRAPKGQEDSGKRCLLVLDSEGLMSVNSGSNVFDQQIALLCLACSHLVLVNHKGEISRILQNLMEVALWALGELRVLRIRPKIVFVLRDQEEFRNPDVHRDMLQRMRTALQDAAREADQELSGLLDLDDEGIFLMPGAFTKRKEFAEQALRLRRKIFQWLEGIEATQTKEFLSLRSWHVHCTSVFTTLVHAGNTLLHFKALHEIQR
uniref:VLIG-type G domain-containing protein n=1 Tax=Chromera velia CCMP2878 TaxID=1169474 RepID=A0A0G4G5G8_9ALVE|eukprot:Cvel_4199.t1-p1 / transcript=Cvel_4199.t1 / gene=Cvel_4199 / organism=Chromera_velia_CCMP2878 / gene_product=Interferon-induced very large GTPase 1, putative / transcript_product=Interferon-induced very large GTPase 1, putative / location=Cvel_scaffold181:47417-53472(-) / protein_length=1385 / sequence_SO=supercontig / SO=protein_coding / is_pseudo=false